MVKKYRKKPVEIEAIQWTGDNFCEIRDFCSTINYHLSGGTSSSSGTVLIHDKTKLDIVTLEGTMTADSGDYIIKGVNGEFYPCKPDIFDKTYEQV